MDTPDIVDWLFLILGLWIYFDATHHKIGKVKGLKGFPNMTAGAWATWASCTYIGLIPAAFYILHRRNLKNKASTHPVEVGIVHRVLVAGLLFILPMFLSEFFSSLV